MKFHSGDMNKKFGFPCGPRDIYGIVGRITIASIDFMKKNVGTIGNDSQILKQAEFLLSWDITELLSETEMAYFKTTCVYLLWVIWEHLLLDMGTPLIIGEPYVGLVT